MWFTKALKLGETALPLSWNGGKKKDNSDHEVGAMRNKRPEDVHWRASCQAWVTGRLPGGGDMCIGVSWESVQEARSAGAKARVREKQRGH